MLFFLCFRPTIKIQDGSPVGSLFEPSADPLLTRPLKNYFYRHFGVSEKSHRRKKTHTHTHEQKFRGICRQDFLGILFMCLFSPIGTDSRKHMNRFLPSTLSQDNPHVFLVLCFFLPWLFNDNFEVIFASRDFLYYFYKHLSCLAGQKTTQSHNLRG